MSLYQLMCGIQLWNYCLYRLFSLGCLPLQNIWIGNNKIENKSELDFHSGIHWIPIEIHRLDVSTKVYRHLAEIQMLSTPKSVQSVETAFIHWWWNRHAHSYRISDMSCDSRDKNITIKCQTVFTPMKSIVLLLCASWLLNVTGHHCIRQHAKKNPSIRALTPRTHTHTHTSTSMNSTKWDRTYSHWIFETNFGRPFCRVRVNRTHIHAACIGTDLLRALNESTATTGKRKRNATTFRWAWPLDFPIKPLRKHYSRHF